MKQTTSGSSKSSQQDTYQFLGKSKMAGIIAAFDWSKTSLGPIADWPQSLRTAVNIMLHSDLPMVMLWGGDGVMSYNDAYAVFAGARHPKLLGAKVVEGWPEVADFNKNVMKQGLAGKNLSYKDQTMTLYRNHEAEKVSMNLNYSPIMDESGKPAGVLAIVVETTERMQAEAKQKRAEDELQAERNMLQNLFMKAPAFICALRGKDHIYEMSNDLHYQLVGFRDIIGKPIREALPEMVEQGIVELLDSVLNSGKPFVGNEMPVQLRRKKNAPLEERFVNFVYQPIEEADGSYSGIFVHGVDVTEQVIARKKVEESEERFRLMAEGSDILIAMSDETSNAVYFNSAWADLTGRPVEDLMEFGWADLVHPEDRDEFVNLYLKAFKKREPWTGEFRILYHDDSYRWLLAHGSPRFRSDGTFAGYISSSTDITDRKQAEEAAKEREERFQLMANNIQNLAWMADADGWIYWYNDRWYEYTGSTFEEMQGWGWEKVHHPDHIKQIVAYVKEAWPRGEPFELTFPLKRHDGVYRWFLTRVVPIKNSDGKVERWIGTNTDIEDLRQRHEIEQRMELLTEQKNVLVRINKTKDEFIALASHQLRTPATAVKQYVGLLKDGFAGTLTPTQMQYLETAYESNERELRIINDLLKTAQIDSSKYRLDKQSHDIVAMAKEVMNDLKTALAQRRQTVTFSAPKGRLKVPMDATEMKLVFMNLLENASKYSYHGTAIDISIVQNKNTVSVAFSDKGVGISKENKQRIFDKFTRVNNDLSDTVTGTGLGLYWVKQIVELHGGSIQLDSTLGKGSTFTVKLPL